MNSFLYNHKNFPNKFSLPQVHFTFLPLDKEEPNKTSTEPRNFFPLLALSPSAWRQLQALEPFKGVNTSPPILHLRMKNFGQKKSQKIFLSNGVFFFNGDKSYGIESVKKTKTPLLLWTI